MMKAKTLTEALTEAAAAGRGGVRLVDGHEQGDWLAWDELLRRSRCAAAGIRERGVGSGERVTLVYPTGKEFLVAFFAVLLAGAVPAPVYPPVRLGRLDEYYDRTSAMWRAIDVSLVLSDGRARRLLGPVLERTRPSCGCCRLEDLPAAGDHAEPRGERDLALIQFSSGTATAPKPVALSESAILAQVRAFNALFPDSAECRHSGVSWLPLYHDMGLIGALLGAVVRGAELTLIPPELFIARPAIWLRAISRYRATVSPAPNFAYGLATEKIRDEELDGVDLSSWRLALNGAEPVVASTLRRFSERFAPYGFSSTALTPVYGLAEASLAVTFSAIERPFVSQRFTRVSLEAGRRVELGASASEASEL
ncbi:MAG TPA: AMP-binding protein, partial [Thermoanaerobaculia bacterium]|nr:AMP-binding protein [Thermoanaerobaculia bacterium]